MKKVFPHFIIALLLCSLSLPAALCAQQTLVISTLDNASDIKIEESILRRAYQRLGIEVSIIGMPPKRSLRSANTGQTDGEAARVTAIELEYQNLIRINVPIRVIPMHIYVKAGDEFSINGWDSIPGNYVFGYRRGLKFAEYAVSEHNLKSITNNDEKSLFRQLSTGRIDITLANSIEAKEMIEELQLSNIVQLEPPIHVSSLYHYLHKKHAQLVPEITRVLQEMEADGTLQEINEQFIAARE